MAEATNTEENQKITPQIEALQVKALDDPEIKALGLLGNNIIVPKEVKTEADYDAICASLLQVKEIAALVENHRVIRKKPFMDASNAIQAHFKSLSEPLAKQERELKALVGKWVNEQQRLQRIEDAKADEIARKAREKLEKRAAAAQAKGQEEKAEALVEEAGSVVAEVAAPAAKTKGVSTVQVWKWKLTDKKQMNSNFMEPDEKKINALVKASPEDAADMIGGIEVYAETQVKASKG